MDYEVARHRHRTAASQEELRRCLDALVGDLDRTISGEIAGVEVMIVEPVADAGPGELDLLEGTLVRWLAGGERVLRLDADGLLVVVPHDQPSGLGTGSQLVRGAAHCAGVSVVVGVARGPEDGRVAMDLVAHAQAEVNVAHRCDVDGVGTTDPTSW